MANPAPNGALSSSAGVRTAAVAALRGQLPAFSSSASGPSSSSGAGGGSPMAAAVFTGLLVAVGLLAYWYRRIL